MGLLETIKEKLEADAVVDGSAWRCFLNFLPDVQDQIVSLHLTGGFPQDTLGNENVVQTFQVLVRAGDRDFTVCENKWWEMFNSLQDADFTATPVSDETIYLCQAMASGPMIFSDNNERVNMTANFRVIRQRPV